MATTGCPAKVSISNKSADIYFSAQPPINPSILTEGFKIINSALTHNQNPLTIAILIKSKTAIKDLSSLQGERLAIISHNSYIGGEQAVFHPPSSYLAELILL